MLNIIKKHYHEAQEEIMDKIHDKIMRMNRFKRRRIAKRIKAVSIISKVLAILVLMIGYYGAIKYFRPMVYGTVSCEMMVINGLVISIISLILFKISDIFNINKAE